MILESLLALCLVGDSYTAGAVSGPPDLSYAARLEDLLPLPVVNVALPAAGTRNWLPERWAYQTRLAPCLPGALSIMLGTVDALDGPGRPIVPAGEYRSNLETIVSAALEDGADPIILSIPAQAHFLADAELLEAYRQHILELCEASDTDSIVCGADLSELSHCVLFA